MMHLVGEMIGVALMGVFHNPNVANSIAALILAISGLIASGFLRSDMRTAILYQSQDRSGDVISVAYDYDSSGSVHAMAYNIRNMNS